MPVDQEAKFAFGQLACEHTESAAIAAAFKFSKTDISPLSATPHCCARVERELACAIMAAKLLTRGAGLRCCCTRRRPTVRTILQESSGSSQWLLVRQDNEQTGDRVLRLERDRFCLTGRLTFRRASSQPQTLSSCQTLSASDTASHLRP